MRLRPVLPALLLLGGLLILAWALASGSASNDPVPADRRATASERPGVRDVPRTERPAPPEAPGAALAGRARPPAADGEAAGRLAIHGRVLDFDGTPRRRAVVRLERSVVVDIGGRHAVRLLEVARRRTDPTGRFVFEHLVPSACVVTALAPAGRLATQREVELVDRDVEIELAWRRPVRARVAVFDPAGRPIPGAHVAAEAPGAGRLARAESGADGLATLEGLDPDLWLALVVVPPGGGSLAPYREEPWTVGDTHVTLEAALRVTGRVVDEEGRPFPLAQVRRQLGANTISHASDKEGRFVIEQLDPGPVVLEACAPDWFPGQPGPSLTVDAGAQGVELVAPRGRLLEIRIPEWPAGARGSLRIRSEVRDDVLVASIGPDGAVAVHTFEAQEPYALWGTVHGDDRFVHRRGVRHQDEPLVLDLESGDAIHVEVEAPEHVEIRHVWAHGRAVLRRPREPPSDGVWRIPSLPPGVWTVRAVGTSTGDHGPARAGPAAFTHEGSCEARPGDQVRIVLAPRTDR